MATGWKGSTRRRRLPRNWPQIRARILERDRHACRWIREDTGRRCGAYATEVDHIHRGDDHRDSNLQALCDWHHQQKSAMEGGMASKAAAERRRAEPQHPGLI
ncbi:HNH endonuclease [Puerhibacterium puerhi]|uniref:HNH endonuclease n=1 Tax=Puerhibacterium puerhi TaxID=2692623 RepID=UPI00135ADBD7|nr:HNH endonuclease [Puerhibacterium puerhi]